MSWRGLNEIHLLYFDSNGQLQPLGALKTLSRATFGGDYGYDVEMGVGRALPRLSAPNFTVSLEGWVPNVPNFLELVYKTYLVLSTPPVPDANYTNMLDYVANAQVTETTDINNVVIDYGTVPNRFQITLDDSGLHGTFEFNVIDTSVGLIRIEYDSVNATVTGRYILPAVPTWMPAQIDIPEGLTQPVYDEVYPPETARKAVSLTITDGSGNTINVIPTSLQVTFEFNPEIRYGVTGQTATLMRSVPQVTVEMEVVPGDVTPMEFKKLALQRLNSPSVITIQNFLTLEVYEYIVQSDDFVVSDDFQSPRVTLIPLRYVAKDGNGTVLFGWI